MPEEGAVETERDHVNDWENPQIIGRNKERGHATLVVYADKQTALQGSRGKPGAAPQLFRWKYRICRMKHYWAGNGSL